MKLFLVETHTQVDTDTLDCLSSWLPNLQIEVFEDASAVLSVPPSNERLFICVSNDLVTSNSLDSVRRLQTLFPRATLVLIRRTADLLPLCTMMGDGNGHADSGMQRRNLAMAASAPAEAATPMPSAQSRLSARETEILMLLREGLQNKLIARRLDLSVSTVKTHIANIFRKIGASNRLDAICKFADRSAPARSATVEAFPRPNLAILPQPAMRARWAA